MITGALRPESLLRAIPQRNGGGIAPWTAVSGPHSAARHADRCAPRPTRHLFRPSLTVYLTSPPANASMSAPLTGRSGSPPRPRRCQSAQTAHHFFATSGVKEGKPSANSSMKALFTNPGAPTMYETKLGRRAGHRRP